MFPQYKVTPTEDYWTNNFRENVMNDLITSSRASQIIKFLVNYIEKESLIVEAGTCFGRFLMIFKEEGYSKITGFDCNIDLINNAKKFNLNVKCADIRYMPYKSESFDLYLDIGTMEHFLLNDQYTILQEIRRILKPNGLAAIDVAYFNIIRKIIFPIMSLKNWFKKLKGDKFYQYIYTKKDIKVLLAKHNFILIKTMKRGPRMLFLARKIS